MKKITTEHIRKRLAAENPWWSDPHVIPEIFSAWRPRPYFDLFFPLVASRSIRRAVVFMGPRRVGKTVMIHHAIDKLLREEIPAQSIGYISVDHPIYNNLGLDDLVDHYAQATGTDYTKQETFLFFDEIQYLKDWERYLKLLVDRYPLMKCIVSGSAAAALRLKSTESGAGRFTDFLLPPLTFHEYLHLLDKISLVTINATGNLDSLSATNIEALNNEFIDYINYGGYPEVIFSKEIQLDPGRFIKSDIIDKVLLRDLPSLYGVQDIQELNSLFTTIAYNTANEISLNDLSKNSGIAKNTIKRYIEYLEAAFLIKIIHRVDKSAKRFSRANYFKVYLTNPSIRAALFSPVHSTDEAMGDLVETAIFSQWFHWDTLPHYARWDKGGQGEVDIVLIDPKTQKALVAVESKWSDRYFAHPEQLKSLLHFCNEQKLKEAQVTTITQQGKKYCENVLLTFTPASLHCFTLGLSIIEGKKLLL